MKIFRSAKHLLQSITRHPKFFAFILFCALVAVPVAHAQYSLNDYQKGLDCEGQCLNKFVGGNFAGFLGIATTSVSGCPTCKNSQLKTGAISATGNMIAALYDNPPASGVYYAQDILRRFNPVQPAYAQTSTGFVALQPLLSIWRAFRDFSYAFFAVLFIGIGLAIMFRMKLDPRTVITVQSAIPRIVIALLLVTFSYAIAGFMIDLLYVIMSIGILIFAKACTGGNCPNVEHFQTMYLTGGLPELWSSFWGIMGGWKLPVGSIGSFLLGVFIHAGTLGAADLIAAPFILAGMGGMLVSLLIVLFVLWLIFTLFLDLLKAYVYILFLVIFGPFQIALGVIPGVPGFSSWIKALFTNILIFPGVAFVLMLGQTLMNLEDSNKLWSPPLLAGGSVVAYFIPWILGIGILMVTHQVPEAIRTFMSGKAFEFAPGEAIGATTGFATGGAAGALEQGARRPGVTTTRAVTLGGIASILRGMGGGARRR